MLIKEETPQEQYKKMTETPVNKLVITLAVPTVISMLVTNIYNMADTFFVSRLGTSASGATGVVFALMAIIQAFGFMLGHGAGSNISRQLGSKNVERARTFAATSFLASLIAGGMIAVLGIVFQKQLMLLLGSTKSILPYAMQYSFYILIAAPAMASSCVMNNILRYEGKAVFAMLGLTSGSILNIIGDYILIFHFNMGIEGAGLSTAVSQYIGAVILFMPYALKQVQSRLNLRYVTKDWRDLTNILACGFPSMMRQGLNSVSVMVLNHCSAPFGDAAISAMSIVSRVTNFLFCVGIGIGQGFQPVSAFNYGAGKYSRVKSACKFTWLFSTILLCVAAFFGFVYAQPIIRVFRDDAKVIEIGVMALRLQTISLILVPISVCGNMLFQSIGKSGRATFLASTRSGLFFIPLICFFSHFFGLFGIEITQMITDLLAVAVTVPMIYVFFKQLPQDKSESFHQG